MHLINWICWKHISLNVINVSTRMNWWYFQVRFASQFYGWTNLTDTKQIEIVQTPAIKCQLSKHGQKNKQLCVGIKVIAFICFLVLLKLTQSQFKFPIVWFIQFIFHHFISPFALTFEHRLHKSQNRFAPREMRAIH